MRYYVGITHMNSPAPAPSELKLPPFSCFWVSLDAESPMQAQHVAEPVLCTVIHPALREISLEMLSRRQWTAQIFAYGAFPQQRYEVAEIVDGKPRRLREVRASSPHEAIEDVNSVLAELPRSATPRLLQATLIVARKKQDSHASETAQGDSPGDRLGRRDPRVGSGNQRSAAPGGEGRPT